MLEFDLSALTTPTGVGDVKLQISLPKSVALKHGWYSYLTERHYLDCVRVGVIAPWPVRPKVNAPWVRWTPQGPTSIGEGNFATSVTLRGPVPKDLEVAFIVVGATEAKL